MFIPVSPGALIDPGPTVIAGSIGIGLFVGILRAKGTKCCSWVDGGVAQYTRVCAKPLSAWTIMSVATGNAASMKTPTSQDPSVCPPISACPVVASSLEPSLTQSDGDIFQALRASIAVQSKPSNR